MVAHPRQLLPNIIFSIQRKHPWKCHAQTNCLSLLCLPDREPPDYEMRPNEFWGQFVARPTDFYFRFKETFCSCQIPNPYIWCLSNTFGQTNILLILYFLSDPPSLSWLFSQTPLYFPLISLSFGQMSFLFRHIFFWCRRIYSKKYILTNMFQEIYSDDKYIPRNIFSPGWIVCCQIPLSLLFSLLPR